MCKKNYMYCRCYHLLLAILFIATNLSLWGQSSLLDAPADSASLGFKAQHMLAQSLRLLLSQGITPAQLQLWQQQNASLLATRMEWAQNAETLAQVPLSYIEDITLPENATQEMFDLLAAQANSANGYAQQFNSQLQALPTGVVSTTALIISPQNQSPSAVVSQQGRAQVVSAQSGAQTQALPPPLVIPKGSSTQMQAFLVLRDRLIRSQIIAANQYDMANDAEKDAALRAWQQQNAVELQQMRQLAQSLPTNASQ